MNKLQRADLWNVKDYALRRDGFRTLVIAHKSQRRIALGAHATLLFEDFLTMKYQVQEMLRAERIFEVAGIQEEIDAYNPLVPDGANWKATMLIEYDDVDERRRSLAQLAGVEHRVWAQIAGTERVCAIANEDLERRTTEKTSAVHFFAFRTAARRRKCVARRGRAEHGYRRPALAVRQAAEPRVTRRDARRSGLSRHKTVAQNPAPRHIKDLDAGPRSAKH